MSENQESTCEFPAAAEAELRRGRKIEAIKIIRESRGLGLKEAKNEVEAYVGRRPELQQAMKEATAGARGSLIKFLLVLAVLAVAAYYFLGGK